MKKIVCLLILIGLNCSVLLATTKPTDKLSGADYNGNVNFVGKWDAFTHYTYDVTTLVPMTKYADNFYLAVEMPPQGVAPAGSTQWSQVGSVSSNIMPWYPAVNEGVLKTESGYIMNSDTIKSTTTMILPTDTTSLAVGDTIEFINHAKYPFVIASDVIGQKIVSNDHESIVNNNSSVTPLISLKSPDTGEASYLQLKYLGSNIFAIADIQGDINYDFTWSRNQDALSSLHAPDRVFTMDESSGNITSYDGVVGTPFTDGGVIDYGASGMFNTSISFPNSSGSANGPYFELNRGIVYNSPVVINMWINQDRFITNCGIFSALDSFCLYVGYPNSQSQGTGSNVISLVPRINQCKSTQFPTRAFVEGLLDKPTPNKWTMLTIVIWPWLGTESNPPQIITYINGTNKQKWGYDETVEPNFSAFNISNCFKSNRLGAIDGLNTFNGSIDELYIWYNPLSQIPKSLPTDAQIEALYANGKGAFYVGKNRYK